MSSNDLYAHEEQLAIWLEILMRWMSHKRINRADTSDGYSKLIWDAFRQEYPSIASDMEKWLEAWHDEEN